MESSEEQPLSGGWVNQVVRAGDTVRRSTGPWTPAVHALLRHLEAVGFTEAPRVLGIDDQGREVLTYIEGHVAHRPWPDVLLTDDGIAALGRLLRRYHDAVSGWSPPPDAVWRAGKAPLQAGWVVRHGDFAPWNVIYRDEAPVGLIDWDFAEPGPPIYDLAQLAWYAVPLSSEGLATEAGFHGQPDRRSRLRALCDAYGRRVSAAAVLEAASAVQSMDLMRARDWGGRGIEPWASFLQRGEIERIEADIAWLAANRASLI